MKLQYKLLLAPAVTIAFLLAFGVVALSSLQTQRQALNVIVTEGFDEFAAVAQITKTIDEQHARAYRLLTWMTNYGEDKIKAMTGQILGELDGAIKKLQDAKAAETEAAHAMVFADLVPELQKYRKEVAQAIDMASADVSTGLGMMQAADVSFEKVDAKLEQLVRQHRSKADEHHQTAGQAFARARTLSVILLVLAIAGGIAISLIIARQIMRPVNQAKQALARVASGDLTGEVKSNSTDEIGEMLASVEVMRRNLTHMIGAVHTSSEQVMQATEKLAVAADSVAQASQQQSDDASSMAAAIEELTVSVNQMADNANQARELSDESGKVSREGGAVIQSTLSEMSKIETTVGEAARTVEDLGNQSEQISKVIGVIREIAEQTNLLALNAAIEAARAGEQGRGFAVVADEVRKLAERTAQSTEEIRQVVVSIQAGAQSAVSSMQRTVSAVGAGVALAAQAGTSTSQITSRTQAMVNEVAAITSALKEQGAASNEIAGRVERIVRMTEANGASAKGSAEAARQLKVLADTMRRQISEFRV